MKQKHKKIFAKLAFILCAALLICSVPFTVLADESETAQTIEEQVAEMLAKDRVPGELIVQFFGEVSTQAALDIIADTANELVTIEPIFQKTAEHPDVPENFWLSVGEERICEILTAFKSNPCVKSAQPNYRYSIHNNTVSYDQSAPPSNVNIATTSSVYTYDSNNQWALDKIGVQSAWNKGFTGSSSIKIGVLDSGIDIDHPDLQDNIDRILAYNAMTQQTGINYVNDTDGHGTIVSGVIAADINQTGISGVCKNISLVPIKVYDGGSEYNDHHVQRGIAYAFDRGIYILNFSYTLDTTTYNHIAQYIELWDGIFVVSAGNGGVPMEEYSAAEGKCHNDPWWVVVGASTSSDTRWESSNYSTQFCDLFAPGEEIYTTTNNGSYDTTQGTSLAAPHMAAAIALIQSHATHYSHMEIKELLLDTVDEITGFEDLCVTGGRLSIINAVNALYSENRGAYSLGDLNGNGHVEITDYMMAKRAVLGTYTLSPIQENAMDINGDNVLNSLDYMLIERYTLQTYYFAPN